MQHSSGYCSSLHCVPIAKGCPSLARTLHATSLLYPVLMLGGCWGSNPVRSVPLQLPLEKPAALEFEWGTDLTPELL